MSDNNSEILKQNAIETGRICEVILSATERAKKRNSRTFFVTVYTDSQVCFDAAVDALALEGVMVIPKNVIESVLAGIQINDKIRSRVVILDDSKNKV